MSTLPIGKHVVIVGGRHAGRSGSVTEQPKGYPQWYRVRLDGGASESVRVAPNDLAAVNP